MSTRECIKSRVSNRTNQRPGEIKRREVSWTLTKKLAQKRSKEGGVLDSHEEASPEEIKRREVSWTLTKKLAQARSRGGR